MKKGRIIFIFLGFLLIFACLLCYKSTFAVTFFKDPPVSYEETFKQPLQEPSPQFAQQPLSEVGHAPEPATFVLFLGGIAGFVVRFVRKSFAKFKRYMDISVSTLGILISGPVLIFAAILIKLTSKGPVIYKQDRVGENGTIFKIYKLRTMCVDAEKNTGAVWAKKNDPRITEVGRVLRKAHIDEIPQLINVLKGEMSIIGPRPERPEMVRDFKQLIIDYEKRLAVKPGITGLAQIWHKYDETIDDVKKKIKYDLLYIKKMCLLADLKILAQTFVVVFVGKGAR
jgi:exopolysaccharide biosynthesis polyprenyl glycosylphosphotransferase